MSPIRRVFWLALVLATSAHSALADEPVSSPATSWEAQLRPGVKWGGHLTRVVLDTFVPVWTEEDRLMFVNPHVILTDQHTNEGNFGLGYRQLVGAGKWILGGNLFYDERESERGNPFHQVGLGLELLSKEIDVRANYYHPLTKAQRAPDVDSGAFTETSLLRFNGFEEALQGLDYEAGVLVPYLSNILETRIYLGGFYYDAEKAKNVSGHRFRLEIRPNPYLTFEVEWRDIHAADNDAFIGGYVSLPFDLGALAHFRNPFHGWKDTLSIGKGARPLPARMTDAVVRDIDVTTKAKPDSLHPEKVADVVFVDNSYTGTRTGTRSQPHTTLAQATSDSDYGAGVWIFVEKGSGNYTSTNITLANNSTLWGDGFKYLGLGGEGKPVIVGDGTNDVITTGTGDTIQGFTISNVAGATGDGIELSTSPGTTLIRNNTIQNHPANGISLDSGGNGGDITIRDNIFSGNVRSVDLSASGSGSATATLSGNTSSVASGVNNFQFQTSNTFTMTATASNNTITAGGIGIGGTSNNSSTINLTARNNTITGMDTSFGIGVVGNGTGTAILLAENNTIQNTTGAFAAALVVSQVGTTTFTVDFGGGSLGSVGQNRLLNNVKDLGATATGTFKAESNWFGSATATPGIFAGTWDTTPQLTSDPNP